MKRTSLGLHTFVQAQRSVEQPLCLTCGRPLDGERIVEGRPGESVSAQVVGKHHGVEELRTFEFGTKAWDWEQLHRYMAAADWFDPRVEAGEVHITRARV